MDSGDGDQRAHVNRRRSGLYIGGLYIGLQTAILAGTIIASVALAFGRIQASSQDVSVRIELLDRRLTERLDLVGDQIKAARVGVEDARNRIDAISVRVAEVEAAERAQAAVIDRIDARTPGYGPYRQSPKFHTSLEPRP